MSSMKMPPRQKMINMMYLVLTAILALNVSKEVLDAFAVMDAELVRSERAHEERSRVEYTVFADMATRFPEKFAVKHQEALRVKAMADSLVHHIEDIKADAVAKADGIELSALKGKDATGRDTLRALLALEMKDDRDVLTQALVGSEPAMPSKGPGTAYELRSNISAFRDSLKALAGEKGVALSAALDALFDFSDRRDASGTMNNWESINFYDVPLAAGVATLSKLQADIRAAENDMVKWLYRSVEVDDYKFGTLTTAVVPQSSLIMAGDSFRADVFLAAYDPKNAPRVTMKDGTTLPIGADGKAKLRLRGISIGEQVVEGIIRFDGPKGVEEVPYTTSFQVMAPLLVASPTKMNVLYRGVENPIDLSVPGVPAERVQATITTGRIARQGNGWVATGMTGNTAEVNAVVPMPDGSTRRIGPATFRVKDLPTPMAYVGQKNALEARIKKTELTAAQGLAAKLPDTEFAARFQVLRFTLQVVRGSQPVDRPVTGSAFDTDVKYIFSKLHNGDRVIFQDIKARLENSPAGARTYDLTPIAWKVVD
ncbi:MAG: gliding motility protein GldM [Flavobacteriales bacterium]|nr:gliding motility protein GldM [Flavobacteriales bacterium]